MDKEDLEIVGTDLNSDRVMGFVRITKLGKAQQVTVSTKLLGKVTKFLAELEKMGFENVTVTVQNGKAIILGGKEIGIGISPCQEDEP
jgi:hypothetical protein